jgi:hypothetical protein
VLVREGKEELKLAGKQRGNVSRNWMEFTGPLFSLAPSSYMNSNYESGREEPTCADSLSPCSAWFGSGGLYVVPVESAKVGDLES